MYFLFEDYVLDTDRRELRRGSDIVPLEPQVFDLLAFLIGNRDRVVSKDDLLASVWAGRIVSESTLATRMNAARTAVADSGEAQRLIRTLPRKGFRFVGDVREEQILPREERFALPPGPALPAVTQAPHPRGIVIHPRWMVLVGLVAAGVVGLLLALAFWPQGPRPSIHAGPSPKFDPAVIPLIDDRSRLELVDYAGKPGHKALAISAVSWAQVSGRPDIESAKTEALQRCGLRPQSACTLYAVDMDVVWPNGIVPVAARADQRTEPLPGEFTAAGSAVFAEPRRRAFEAYSAVGDHRALAASPALWNHWVGGRTSREEAERLALERCGYGGQAPCLLLSVDGSWTVEIPATRKILNVFLPSFEAELPAEQRQRIAVIYQGKPWRALARGRNGTWHAVAGAESEAAAVEAALQSCAQADSECQLFAIGNFRVADSK